MFLIKILSFVLCFAVSCVVFSILFLLIKFIAWLTNGLKKQIVWIFADKISSLVLFPAQKRYRRDAVETGYSTGYYYRSHYRYKTVFDGTYRKAVARFKNNIKVKFEIKEESPLYKRLLSTALIYEYD